MSAYLVVDVAVRNIEMFKEYARKSKPLVEKYGGVYLVRGGDVEIQEGTWSPQRLVVVEFPNQKKVKAFLADPDYRLIAEIRHAAATSNMIIVDGFQAAS